MPNKARAEDVCEENQHRNLKPPTSPKEAREWLKRTAIHLLDCPRSGQSLRFVGSALLWCLESEERQQRLCDALGIDISRLPGKRGQPRISPGTVESICVMLKAGHPPSQIATTLDVPRSCVSRVNTKRNKLLQIWQRGAKPDKFSLEDAQKFADTIPEEEVVAIYRAEISAEDIIPEEEKKIFTPEEYLALLRI